MIVWYRPYSPFSLEWNVTTFQAMVVRIIACLSSVFVITKAVRSLMYRASLLAFITCVLMQRLFCIVSSYVAADGDCVGNCSCNVHLGLSAWLQSALLWPCTTGPSKSHNITYSFIRHGMSERTPPATLHDVNSTGYKVLSEWIHSYSNNRSTISIRFCTAYV